MSSNNENMEKNYVPTVLSLLQHDEAVMSDVQKEILEDELKELEPITDGDVNISGVYNFDIGDKIEVKVYIRNGHSRAINFEYVPLSIVNSKGETLAYQVFNLSYLGDIPSKGARPGKLYFDKKNVFVDKIPEDWKVIFHSSLKAVTYAKVEYENLMPNLDYSTKEIFINFLNELPKIKVGNVDFSKFSIGLQKDGNLAICLIIRNGVDRPIKIEQLPITVKDENNKTIASNVFNTEDFQIGANKARISYFMFPTGVEVQEDIDLTNSWSITYESEEIDNSQQFEVH